MKFLLLIGIGILSLSTGRAERIGGYDFTLNGEPFEPRLLTTEAPEPVSGDVIFVRGTALSLGEPGTYAFETDGSFVRRKMADGSKIIVACMISAPADSDVPLTERIKSKLKANPLADMDDKSLSELRGLTLSTWPKGIEKQWPKLNWNQLCLSLEDDALDEPKALEAIPSEVQYLLLDSGGTWEMHDFRHFSKLRALRFLELGQTMPREFDFGVLGGLKLSYLSLPHADKVSHLEALPTLQSLKTLAANSCDYLEDGRWIGKLSDLRQLFASHVETEQQGFDFAALAPLEKLVTLKVAKSKVASLPTTKMPALKHVSLLLSTAPKEQSDAFQKANPQAQMQRSMTETLAQRIAKAEHLRVRTGGLCHRIPEEEKEIFTTKDAKIIRELAAQFSVEEDASGFHCMCCGNPSFEFYEGDRCVAMIGFHHGKSIRWDDGDWPGDGMLTKVSAEFLVHWLAQHGCTGPQDEMLAGRRQMEALQRRKARYAKLIPTAIGEALQKAESLEAATAAFEDNLKDPKARATLFLQLFGCDQGRWAVAAAMDEPLAQTWIPTIPNEQLRAAIRDAADGTEAGRGAARWIFGEGHTDLLSNDSPTLLRLARFSLTHPQQGNRWRTLGLLRDVNTAEAVQVLREVLKKGTSPDKLTKEEAFEPGGQVTFHPRAISLPESCSDQVAAAFCLAKLKDASTLTEVTHLRNLLSKEEREEWDDALEER